jgi:hypothetical protein
MEKLASTEDTTARQREWAQLLDPSSGQTVLSNLEFAAAIKDLYASGWLSKMDGALLDCPLALAAQGRDIGAFGSVVVAEATLRGWRSVGAATLLQSAREAKASGDALLALGVAEVAVEKYREEISGLFAQDFAQRAVLGSISRNVPPDAIIALDLTSSSWSFSNVVAMTLRSLGVQNDVQSVIDVNPATINRFESYGSNTLSVALNDYALALRTADELRTEIMGPDYASESSLMASVRANALGASVASDPNWSVHNLDTLRATTESFPRSVAEMPDSELLGDPERLLLLGLGNDIQS